MCRFFMETFQKDFYSFDRLPLEDEKPAQGDERRILAYPRSRDQGGRFGNYPVYGRKPPRGGRRNHFLLTSYFSTLPGLAPRRCGDPVGICLVSRKQGFFGEWILSEIFHGEFPKNFYPPYRCPLGGGRTWPRGIRRGDNPGLPKRGYFTCPISGTVVNRGRSFSKDDGTIIRILHKSDKPVHLFCFSLIPTPSNVAITRSPSYTVTRYRELRSFPATRSATASRWSPAGER
jgi:hypothetical protein